MNTFTNISSFRKLFPKLLLYKKGLIQLIFLQLIWIFMELVTPFLTQALVDKGINNQDYNFILLVLAAQLLIFVGSMSSDIYKTWILRHIGIRLNMKLVNSYLSILIIKNILFFKENKEGKLIQVYNDNFRIENFLTESVASFMNAIFRIILYGVILLIFNKTVFLIFISSIIISLVWDFIFLKQKEIIDHMVFSLKSMTRTAFLEILNGIGDIKVNNLEWERIHKWENIQDVWSQNRLRLLKIVQFYKGGNRTFNQLRYIFVIFICASLVIKGTLTLGAMLAIQYIIGKVDQYVLDISKFIADYLNAKLSLERVNLITQNKQIEYTPSNSNESINIKGAISFNNICFDYGDFPCLKNINLQIPYGSNLAILGESGSGKSTLLSILLKLLIPDDGKIYINEERLSDIKNNTWRNNCSTVVQEGIIFNGSLIYNITLNNNSEEIDKKFLRKVINIACLDKIVDQLNDGVETKIGKGGKTFSKGQAQRILLARALYKNGNFLIMDEPTSALDKITAKKVISNIKDFAQNKTFIFCTHKLNMVKDMDHIIVMDNGKIVEQGTHHSLIQLKGKYYQLNQN